MTIGSLTIGGRRFVVVPEDEFKRLTSGSSGSTDDLPPMPQADSRGNVPAIAYARAGLARKLILGRRAAGWSQAELARRAGIRTETVNRIERGKNTPDARTFAKLERALRKAGAEI